MQENLKCCFTGYRPSKFPFPMNENNPQYLAFENALYEEIISLVNKGCTTFITGMAMGFDIIAAETVLNVARAVKDVNVTLHCVLPFENQVDTFYDSWKERYLKVLKRCDRKTVLSEEYFSGCYAKRNKFMVDNSDYVLTWYDGKSGGTKNTIDYALKKQRAVININKDFDSIFAVQEAIEII